MKPKKQSNWSDSILKTVAKNEKEKQGTKIKIVLSSNGQLFELLDGKWVKL